MDTSHSLHSSSQSTDESLPPRKQRFHHKMFALQRFVWERNDHEFYSCVVHLLDQREKIVRIEVSLDGGTKRNNDRFSVLAFGVGHRSIEQSFRPFEFERRTRVLRPVDRRFDPGVRLSLVGHDEIVEKTVQNQSAVDSSSLPSEVLSAGTDETIAKRFDKIFLYSSNQRENFQRQMELFEKHRRSALQLHRSE